MQRIRVFENELSDALFKKGFKPIDIFIDHDVYVVPAGYLKHMPEEGWEPDMAN